MCWTKSIFDGYVNVRGDISSEQPRPVRSWKTLLYFVILRGLGRGANAPFADIADLKKTDMVV